LSVFIDLRSAECVFKQGLRVWSQLINKKINKKTGRKKYHFRHGISKKGISKSTFEFVKLNFHTNNQDYHKA